MRLETLTRPLTQRWVFPAILATYLFYAGWFISRTSFIVEGERYYCLFDDAMISMTYARNLAQGHGLVWYPGTQRVEGYSSPLWTLYMALVHLIPVAEAKISLLVQATSAALLALNLLLVRRLTMLLSPGGYAWIPAVLLTAFFLPLNNWALQGMEVGLLALLATASAWFAVKTVGDGRFRPGVYLVLGAALLTRLDAAVLFAAVWGFLLAADPAHRRRHLAWGLALFAGINLAMLAFRLFCYGDLLPNTYYLKMTGYPLSLRLARGTQAFGDMVAQMAGILFVLPFGVLLLRDRTRALLPVMVLAQIAYSIWAGGDAWENWGLTNRYLTVVMPLFLMMLCVTLGSLEAWLRARVIAGTAGASLLQFSIVAALGLAAVDFNAVNSPNPSLREWLGVRPPLAVEDNRRLVESARLLGTITTPDARLGVTWAGIIPYFSGRQGVDFLGKNDRYIARLPAHLPTSGDLLNELRPGHVKWDYNYSIRRLRPDVVIELFGTSREEAEAYLAADYLPVEIGGEPMRILKTSDHVDWSTIAP